MYLVQPRTKNTWLEAANDDDSIGRTFPFFQEGLNKASGGFSSSSVAVFVFGAGSIRTQQQITKQKSTIPQGL